MDYTDADVQIYEDTNINEILGSLVTENKNTKEFIANIFKGYSNLNAVLSLQDKEFKSLESKMNEQINTISEKYSRETSSLQSLVHRQTKQISALEEINSKKSKEVDEMKRNFYLEIDKLKKESLANYNKISQLESQTSDFCNHLNLLEMKLFSPIGVFIWRVDRFEEKLKKKGVDFSEFFYSHRDGYKMWLCLFSGGARDFKENQDFRGTHLSLQFQVLKGEYDEKLKWPFHNYLNLGIIVSSKPLKVMRYKQKCLMNKNELSPLFNFSFQDVAKHHAMKNDSIVFIYSFEDFHSDDLLVL